MVDIAALMKSLPVSALEPGEVAFIDGFAEVAKEHGWQKGIELLEPPASQRVPYLEPLEVLEQLLRRRAWCQRMLSHGPTKPWRE